MTSIPNTFGNSAEFSLGFTFDAVSISQLLETCLNVAKEYNIEQQFNADHTKYEG